MKLNLFGTKLITIVTCYKNLLSRRNSDKKLYLFDHDFNNLKFHSR